MFTGFTDAVEASTVGFPTRHLDTNFVIGFDLAVTRSSPAPSCLCSSRHRLQAVGGIEKANVEQTQKMIPFITCEISLCQYVCELVLGVNVFDLDLGIQIDSVKQPIKSNSVGSGNMSHCGTSPL